MNNYIITNARLVTDVRLANVNGKDVADCRVADNPMKKTDRNGVPIKARFVTLKFWEGQARLAAKLSKGDVIVPAGELGIETFKNKEGAMQDKDVMRVSTFAVSKSDSFFDKQGAEPTSQDGPDALPF